MKKWRIQQYTTPHCTINTLLYVTDWNENKYIVLRWYPGKGKGKKFRNVLVAGPSMWHRWHIQYNIIYNFTLSSMNLRDISLLWTVYDLWMINQNWVIISYEQHYTIFLSWKLSYHQGGLGVFVRVRMWGKAREGCDVKCDWAPLSHCPAV